MASANVPRVTVGLVQINNSSYGGTFLPYSVALLQAYVETFAREPERFNIKLPIYKRRPIALIVDALTDADVVGFSFYSWNGRISLEIARRLKQRNPGTIIIFGGPHVPDHAEKFLRQNPFIDIAIHNEGERAFLALLEQYPTIDGAAIQGASFLGKNGDYVRTPNPPRVRDLDEIPSPFLSGVFDRLIAANPNECWIGLWETNRGCPFQCTFCDWGSAVAAKVNKFGLQRLMQEVDWFAENKIELIYCCDANFGILGRDIDIALSVGEKKRVTGYPKTLWVQGTKNASDRAYKTLKILSDAGLSQGVSLAMQSLDQGALANIKRDNISLATYFDLQNRFARDRIDTYSDLILGLPGETYDSYVDGVSKLIDAGQHKAIRFNNLAILPNAEMGDPSYRAGYDMVTVESKSVLPGQSREREDDVDEVQDLVISTAAMPASDWRRARVFGWMTALLHFDKLMQIPLIVAHELTGISYREMIEAVMDADTPYPLLVEIRDFFHTEAASIQAGGPEYCYSSEWLGTYWPNDEYVFIKMTADGKLNQFFAESAGILKRLVESHSGSKFLPAVDDAVALSRAFIKRPFTYDDIAVTTDHDVMEFYSAILGGERPQLRRAPMKTVVERSKEPYRNFQLWCRRQEYFYKNYRTEPISQRVIERA